MGMKQAQHQQLFTVLDWGVANAKLEEVTPNPTIMLLHCSPSGVVLCLSLGCPVRQVQIIAMHMQDLYMMHETPARGPGLANQI